MTSENTASKNQENPAHQNERAPADKKPAADAFDMGRDPEAGEAAEIPPPPPPEIDPTYPSDAEDLERARRSYLLKRFWLAAKGFWSRRGDRRAWILTAGLAIGI